MSKQGITKNQSVFLQGVAVLLMIYHHFFNDLSLYEEQLLFSNPLLVQKTAWAGKICVGMFAFISGYGMCRVLQSRRKQEQSFWKTLGKEYLLCVRQIFRVLIRYWAVLIIVMGVFFAAGLRIFVAKEFLENFLCVNPTYNGAFWYVEQYVKMMLILPLWDLLFVRWTEENNRKEKRWFYGTGVILLGICLLGAFINADVRSVSMTVVEAMRPAFVCCMLVGHLCAKGKVFEKARETVSLAGKGEKILAFCAGLLLMAGSAAFRIRLADSAAYATMDFLLVPFWVLGLLWTIGSLKITVKLFYLAGCLSTYMWLTHVFVYELTKEWLLLHTQSHLLFYGMQVMLCGFLSALFLGGECLLRKAIDCVKKQ